ncbi:MAG TPA: nucleotide disphospho-sugar-binding domain-containing protein [candidate division Zixibacteria bacterium]|nr:nucleotide disphospho-sugar-binding domain-containing protein [candidate division Zixibacteria bacterium]
MRIALATVGTTGDVRPFAALAAGLVEAGHRVTAVSWELHRCAFDATGTEFVAAGPATTAEAIHDTAVRAAAARNPADQVAVLRDFHLREAPAHYRRLREVLPGHDLVLLHGIHALAQAAARDARLRWATAVFDPVLLPTRTRPPAGMPQLGPFNRAAWWLLDRMLRRLDAPLHEALAAAGSPNPGAVTMFRARSPRLHLVACAPAIADPPSDLPAFVHVTGAWLPAGEPEPLPTRVTDFLSAGPPPVAVSFGSMAVEDIAGVWQAVVEAVAAVDARAVVQMPHAPEAAAPPGVLLLREAVDHRALFARAAAVVHHGGAGTTHTAAAASVPQVVVPHVGDQPYWAARLRHLGVAPDPLPAGRLNAERLADRLRAALHDERLQRNAARLGAQVAADRGVATAIGLLEEAAAA